MNLLEYKIRHLLTNRQLSAGTGLTEYRIVKLLKNNGSGLLLEAAATIVEFTRGEVDFWDLTLDTRREKHSGQDVLSDLF